jgi:hypothetical protein
VAGALLALEVSVAAALAAAGAIVLSITLIVHALSGSDAVWTRA